VWAQLAAELKDRADVRIAKIDGTQSRVLVSRFHIEGYPSIFILKVCHLPSFLLPHVLDVMLTHVCMDGHTQRHLVDSKSTELVILPMEECRTGELGSTEGRAHSRQ
jgi:hypothetical protein